MAIPVASNSDAQLIIELVSGISPAAEVFARHGTDLAKFTDRYKRDGMFRSAYNEVKREWAADGNVRKRVQFKAGILLEEGLADMFQILKDPHMPAAARLEASKQLANLSGAAPSKEGGSLGAAFSVTINMGEQQVKLSGQPKRTPNLIESSPVEG